VSRLFVVTVASEKGGVGKTTIATNLAVYLKALHEELPVTIASFDNHFSVDQMFALGPRPASGMAELLQGAAPPDLVRLGQYGVQYIASSRRLAAPAEAPAALRSRLEALALEGLLILDTRPILDWFTEAALLAADLVLTPVKDRAALINAAALRTVLAGAGRADRLWLVPSLVDTRARLNREIKVGDFLAFAARERDYQVTELTISKSPRVESLASGFSSRILPVLTHARQTAVHGQLRQLAEFVLARRSVADSMTASPLRVAGQRLAERRLVAACPVCGEPAPGAAAHLFFDLRSRRRGLLHPECFEMLAEGHDGSQFSGPDDLLVLELTGPGMLDEGAGLQLHRFDASDRLVASEQVADPGLSPFRVVLEELTGRDWQTARREWVLLTGVVGPLTESTRQAAWRALAARRRSVLREAMGKYR
jgi:cellulose biosynthesis protein BcsQ